MSAPGTDQGPEGTTTSESGRTPATGDDLRPAAREARTDYVARFVPFAAGIAAVIIAAGRGRLNVRRADGGPGEGEGGWG